MIFSENILICILVPILVIMPFVQRETRRFCQAFMLGMVCCLLGAYLNSFFGDIYNLSSMEIARYIAPVVEEIMRMAPVLLFCVLTRPSNKELLGFGMAVGVGFATFENCCYIIQHGSEMIKFVLVRGLAVGILHVVCGLIIGLGLCLVRDDLRGMFAGFIATLSFALCIHALYNLLVSVEGMSTYIGYCIPIVTLAIVYRYYIYKSKEE